MRLELHAAQPERGIREHVFADHEAWLALDSYKHPAAYDLWSSPHFTGFDLFINECPCANTRLGLSQ